MTGWTHSWMCVPACESVCAHYSDVIMGTVASQITSLTIVYSTLCSDQRKYQSTASLAFVTGIHRWPVNSPHEGPVTQLFPFDGVIMQTGELMKDRMALTKIRDNVHANTLAIIIQLQHFWIYLISLNSFTNQNKLSPKWWNHTWLRRAVLQCSYKNVSSQWPVAPFYKHEVRWNRLRESYYKFAWRHPTI